MLNSWLYVIINALSALLRQTSANYLSPALILFSGGLIAILFFNIINLGKLKWIYKKCWAYKKDWTYINLLIVIIWVCAVYCPSYIGASLYMFLYFAILGLTGIFLTPTNKPQSKLRWISIAGI